MPIFIDKLKKQDIVESINERILKIKGVIIKLEDKKRSCESEKEGEKFDLSKGDMADRAAEHQMKMTYLRTRRNVYKIQEDINETESRIAIFQNDILILK